MCVATQPILNCLFCLLPTLVPTSFQHLSKIGLLDCILYSSQFAAAQDSAPQAAISFFPYPCKRWVQKLCLLISLRIKYLSMTDGIKQGHSLFCRTDYSCYFPWFSSTLQSLSIIEKGCVSLQLSHLTCYILLSLPGEMSYLCLYNILYPLCSSINTDKPNTLCNVQDERRPSCPQKQMISVHIFECSTVN